MDGIEWIRDGGRVLSLIVRRTAVAASTTFVTPNDFIQQAGFVVYPKGGKIAGHTHKPLLRSITGTPETLIVRKGRLLARFYDDERVLKRETVVEAGDILMLVHGGHGFTALEDAVLFEIKQGPYTGLEEKERFE